MKLIFKKAHAYFYVVAVAVLYIILWPLFYYFSRKPSRYHTLNKLRKSWALFSSVLAGFFYEFEYEQPIDWSRTYIFCPNHSSNLDITAMCILVKNEYCFMGKEELKEALATGLFFRTVDISVKRESNISAFRAFKKAGERIKAGISMVIFPEGGIATRYPPNLQNFKNGPFRLAIEQKVPIIPVSIDAWKVFWDDGIKYGTKPGAIHLYVHKPIETAHLSVDDADMLRDQVYNIIKQKTDRITE